MGASARTAPDRVSGAPGCRYPRLGSGEATPRKVVLLVAAYYAAAHLGYAFRFAGPVAAIVWLPVGVGIAGLYLLGLRLWPAVVIGDLLVNNYTGAAGRRRGRPELRQPARGRDRRGPPAPVRLPQGAARHRPGVAGVFAALAVATAVSAIIGRCRSPSIT